MGNDTKVSGFAGFGSVFVSWSENVSHVIKSQLFALHLANPRLQRVFCSLSSAVQSSVFCFV